jgi:hypothetical protein
MYQHGDAVKYAGPASQTISLGRIRSIFATIPDTNMIQLELEPLRRFGELPRQFQSADRRRRSEKHNEHWIDERGVIDIRPADLQGKFSLSIQGSEPNLSKADVIVTEILYSLPPSTTSRIRSSRDRHLLPAEVHRPQLTPKPDMETLKVFLDIYIDDFGTFRSVYHSLGGVYLVIGNQPVELRQKLRNIHLIGFVPFGASFEDYIRPLVEELIELERGVEWTINGVQYWVVIGMFNLILIQGDFYLCSQYTPLDLCRHRCSHC